MLESGCWNKRKNRMWCKLPGFTEILAVEHRLAFSGIVCGLVVWDLVRVGSNYRPGKQELQLLGIIPFVFDNAI